MAMGECSAYSSNIKHFMGDVISDVINYYAWSFDTGEVSFYDKLVTKILKSE